MSSMWSTFSSSKCLNVCHFSARVRVNKNNEVNFTFYIWFLNYDLKLQSTHQNIHIYLRNNIKQSYAIICREILISAWCMSYFQQWKYVQSCYNTNNIVGRFTDACCLGKICSASSCILQSFSTKIPSENSLQLH